MDGISQHIISNRRQIIVLVLFKEINSYIKISLFMCSKYLVFNLNVHTCILLVLIQPSNVIYDVHAFTDQNRCID